MRANLHARGLSLVGADACHDLATQTQRFVDAGYSAKVDVKTMQQVWTTTLAGDERRRWVMSVNRRSGICSIEHIDFLDEPELREQLLQHYCLVYATNAVELDSIAVTTYR